MSAQPIPIFNSVLFNSALFGGASVPGLVIQAGQGLLYPALRKAAITLGPQRTPSPAQFQDAIEELNRLIGSLNCDRLFIYSLDLLEFPLQAGKMSYTIGQDPSGASVADWDVPRPQGITEAYVSYANSCCTRQTVPLLTPQTWTGSCAQGCGVPGIYNDRAYPLSTIYLSGPLSAMCDQIQLFTWHTVPKFTAITDVVVLPDGYEDALVLNLAVRLAPHFQRVLDPGVREDARLSLMRLMSINAPRPIAEIGMCGCSYDIHSDTWQ